MLRAITLIIAVAALLCQRADARLWDTIAEAESRYGPSIAKFPGKQGELDRKYRYKDFLVLVTYAGGKSESEIYARQDEKPLSEREMKFFLDLNSAGHVWERPRDEPMWYLSAPDRKSRIAAAAYTPRFPRTTLPGFMVVTAAYVRRHKIFNI